MRNNQVKCRMALCLLVLLISFAKVSAIDKNDEFIIALKLDRDSYTDSIRVINVVESKIYTENSSTAAGYIPLFNDMIEHHNEEFDESISLYLYQMFSTFPNKHSEFEHYLALLPESDQKQVLRTLALYLFTEFTYEINADTIEDLKLLFWKKFPFLNMYEASREEVERYCTENSYPFD